MQTVVIANHKGGVGKSSVSVQFAHYLFRQGNRVLVLDLDHQQDTTRTLTQSGRVAISKLSTSGVFVSGAAEVEEGAFVLVGADPELAALEKQGVERHKAYLVNARRFLASVADRFDICLIDTNGNPDIRLTIALIVADRVLSPIELNQEAIHGIGALLRTVQSVATRMNPKLRLLGILPNRVQATPFQRQNFIQIVTTHHALLIRGDSGSKDCAFIPHRSVIAEAQAACVPLWEIRKSAAREAWREIEGAFRAIARKLDVKVSA